MNYSNSKIFVVVITVLLSLCSKGCQKSAAVHIEQLNGYWEIDFISRQGETFKPNSDAPLYDFYAIKDQSGFYKKVAPSILGSFQSSDDATLVEIKQKKSGVFLRFKTPWDEWGKKIIALDSQKLILEHEKRSFHYKRPTLININP